MHNIPHHNEGIPPQYVNKSHTTVSTNGGQFTLQQMFFSLPHVTILYAQEYVGFYKIPINTEVQTQHTVYLLWHSSNCAFLI